MSVQTIELAFLQSKAHLLPKQTRADVSAGKIKLVDVSHILRAEVTGGSNLVFLLNSSTSLKKGLSDWDGNKLPALENIIISLLRFGYGKHASEVNSAKIAFSRSLENVPAALQNANLIIKQNDNTLVKMPISALMHEKASDKVVGETGYDLKALQLVVEQAPVEINIEFPEGVTLDNTEKHHIEISLVGQKTTVR